MFARIFLPLIGLVLAWQSAATQTAQRIIRDEHLRGGQTYHWSHDTIYLLEGLVQLEAGGVLHIEEGTVIKGRLRPLIDGQPAGLLIHAGADIMAKGRPSKPIIFTSEIDDLQDPYDLGKTDRGLWGGLIILGRGRLAATQGMQRLPGIHSAQYGGLFDDDNSGMLRYVSVRHAGAPYQGQTSAGIVLAGVGEKTDLHYLEASSSQGDGIQILGGKAILNYAAVSFCGDDQFDWSQGWRGKGSFWFSIQAEDQADCTLEGKGGIAKRVEDLSLPQIDRFTFIGPGQDAVGQTQVAVKLLERSGLNLTQGIVIDYPAYAIEIEDKEGQDDSMDRVKKSGIRVFLNEFWKIRHKDNLEEMIKVANTSNPEDSFWLKYKFWIGNEVKDPRIFSISRDQDGLLSPGIDTLGYPDKGALSSWWLGYWTSLSNEAFLCSVNPISNVEETLGCQFNQIESVYSVLGLSGMVINPFPNIETPCGPFIPPYIVDPQNAAVVRRDRMVLRFDQEELPQTRSKDYCWREIWTFATYNREYLKQIPVDTAYSTLKIKIIDTLSPIIKLEPKPNSLDSIPFEPILFDCDTAWITKIFQTSVAPNLRRYTWEARDYCGNYTEASIDKYLDRPLTKWYLDRDGDGFGDPNASILWPNSPSPGKYVANNRDCNDFSFLSHPNQVDNPDDALDADCDGNGGSDICEQAIELEPGEFNQLNFLHATATYNLPLTCAKTDLNDSGRSIEHYLLHVASQSYLIAAPGQIPGLDDYKETWVIEPVAGTSLFRIRNRAYNSLVNFNGYSLQIVEANNPSSGTLWQISTRDDFHFIQSATYQGFYIVANESNGLVCKKLGNDVQNARWRILDIDPGWPDVWAKAKAGLDGSLAIRFQYDGFYFKLEAYRGSCTNLEPYYCQTEIDLNSIRITDLDPGETVYIRVLMNSRDDNYSLVGVQYANVTAQNDACIDAMPITLPFCSEDTESKMASIESQIFRNLHFVNDAQYFNGEFSGDIWYTLTAPPSGLIEGNSFELYRGDCGSLQRIDPVKTSELPFNRFQLEYKVIPSEKLYLRAFVGHNFGVKPFCINDLYSNTPLNNRPENDECIDAHIIESEDFNKSIPFSSIGATPSQLQNDADADVWFSYIYEGSKTGYPHNIYAGVDFQLFIGDCSNLIPVTLADIRFLSPGERVYIRILGHHSNALLFIVTEKNRFDAFVSIKRNCIDEEACTQSVDIRLDFYNDFSDHKKCIENNNPHLQVSLLPKTGGTNKKLLFDGARSSILTWPVLNLSSGEIPLDSFILEVKLIGACDYLGPNYYYVFPAQCDHVLIDPMSQIDRRLGLLQKNQDINKDGYLDQYGVNLKANELAGYVHSICAEPLTYYIFRKTELIKYNILLPNNTLRPEWRPHPDYTSLWFTCQDQGQTIPLALVVVDRFGNIYWKEVMLHIAQADCTLAGSAGIYGTVTRVDQNPLSGVNLQLKNPQLSVVQSSNQSGVYRFAGLLAAPTYEVTPSKPAAPSKEWGLADILALYDHLLGKAPINTPLSRLAADVNGDGSISSIDLILLRARVLGAIDSFPNMPDWRFLPQPFNVQSIQSTHLGAFSEKTLFSSINSAEEKLANFLAVRVGDVSPRDSKSAQAPATLSLFYHLSPDQSAQKGEQQLRLRIAGLHQTKALMATFAFDPSIIKINSVKRTNLENAELLDVHFTQDELKLMWLTKPNQREGGEDTLDLVFGAQLLQDAPLEKIIKLSTDPDNTTAYDLQNRQVKVLATGYSNASLWVGQNHPNPFNRFSTINFTLNQASRVVISIYSADGQKMLQHEQEYPLGTSAYEFDATILPHGGIYFYQVQIGETIVTKRMVFIK